MATVVLPLFPSSGGEKLLSTRARESLTRKLSGGEGDASCASAALMIVGVLTAVVAATALTTSTTHVCQTPSPERCTATLFFSHCEISGPVKRSRLTIKALCTRTR